MILVLLLSACGQSGAQKENASSIPSSAEAKATIRALDTDSDGKIIVQGLVVENDHGCEVDVSCVLRISSNGSEFNVVYHYGEWPPCENAEASEQGFGVVTGDRVEVYGAITDDGEISTCDSIKFYIRKIDGDSKSIPTPTTTIPPNPTLIHTPSSTSEPTRRSLPTVLGFTDEYIEELETDRYQVAHVTETTVDDKRYVAYVFGESPESFFGRMVLIYRFENDEPVLVLHSFPGEAPRLLSTSGAFDARTEDWNDLNRDGQPDLLIYYNMLGTGSGGVDQAHLVQVDHNGELVELTEPIYNDFHLAPYVIEDINQDGILELIVEDYRGEWYGSSHADGVASFQIYAWESDGSVSDVSANFAEMYEEDITRRTTIVRDSYSKSLSKRDMVNVMAQAFGLLMAYENSGRRDEGWQIYWELTNPENWPQASSESLEIINERRGQHHTQYETGQRFVAYQNDR